MLNKKDVIYNIQEKIWLLKNQAEELEEFLELYGLEILSPKQYVEIKSVATESKIKFSKITNSFENKIDIFNLKK